MCPPVIRPLFALLRTSPDRRRQTLFVLSAVLALVAGFLAIAPQQAEELIRAGGYYYMAGLFAGGVFFAARVLKERRSVWMNWMRSPGWSGVVLVCATAFAIWCDPFKHKILFDEFVLQGTAFYMHATKEIGSIMRAYDIGGTWLPIDTFLDKRPYFFPFLISLLHDCTGFRVANAFVLNVLLAPLFLGLVYWLGATLASRYAAWCAVGLLATMPLLGQQVTGAGMELHNLTMLTVVMTAALLYLRAPSDDRLSLLVFTSVLLAQSRYESVIYVGPVAAVIVAGWLRAGKILLPWAAVFAPLLLVPYAWHNRVLSAKPLLWQLNEGQTSRFSFEYLAGNLEGAWKFFFNFGPTIPNSWYLSVLGAVALVWASAMGLRWVSAARRSAVAPEVFVLGAFGAGIVANLAIIMFYYWSRLDDIMASRFALPMCLLLALLVAAMLQALTERLPNATRWAMAGLGAWTVAWCIPAAARHTYTSQNLVMQEVEWEHEQIKLRRGPLLFICNNSPIPFVLWRIPTVINGIARQRPGHLAYHLREGTFREILVAQALRPTTAQGKMGIDPDDLMPDNFRLEPVAERRFGGRSIRLSRLVSIDPISADHESAKPDGNSLQSPLSGDAAGPVSRLPVP
jgi:hypothetical protein